MYKTIPDGSIAIQPGLWLYTYMKNINNKTYTFNQLYAEPGYCFYENKLLEDERQYHKFAMLSQNLNTVDKINNKYTSIKNTDINVINNENN